MKGVRIVDDRQGSRRASGAHTSGTVLFYDASGALKFSGGIPRRTRSNAGADIIRGPPSSCRRYLRPLTPPPVCWCALSIRSPP